MCNLYSFVTNVEALRAFVKAFDLAEQMGNLQPYPGIFPDYAAPIIRNVSSPHWRPWFGVANRCAVPFTSFSENEALPDGSHPPVWFALSEDRPLAFFAGIYVEGWTGVRKARIGTEKTDLFGFLTTEPNAEVRPVHPKAMPVILRTPEEVATWLTAPIGEALRLQRPLPDGSLVVVARGERRGDPPELAVQLAGALF